MHPLLEDTIAAVATPFGAGAISIIRLSGKLSIPISDSVFKGKQHVGEFISHTVHHGKIVDDDENFIDDVLLTVFRDPHSYTGEDVVEISCHGNPLISQKIIDLLQKKGARTAEPGEFTKRAFLNNKMDLAQAEAVIDVISSRTQASLRGARNQLDGILSKNVGHLRNSLLEVLSFLELELDFAEEDIEFVAKSELNDKIKAVINKIENLLKTYSFGKVIRDGINVAIVGKPNVGKSSLLNYFLKESRAIVSHIPGTTRDIIREEISIDGILFRLFDTAGLRASDDIIEKEGIQKSNESIKNADLVLFINDVEQGYSEDIYTELLQITNRVRIICVMNKIDLGVSVNHVSDVGISVKTGYGMGSLTEKMKMVAFTNASYTEKSAIVSNIRHYNCLVHANSSLKKCLSSISEGLSGEFIAIDLRNAADSLGEIIGEVTPGDVLDNIFSKFCIGK